MTIRKTPFSMVILFVCAFLTSTTSNEGTRLAQLNRLWNTIDQLQKKLQGLQYSLVQTEKCQKNGDLIQENIKLFLSSQTQLNQSMLDYISNTNMYTDCSDVYSSGSATSDIYTIWLNNELRFVYVYCDMDITTTKRGWITIQKRMNGKINFERGWDDYVRGFGTPAGEYWLGLQNMHDLAVQYWAYYFELPSISWPSLRIDLADWDQVRAYANYKKFLLKPDYRLNLYRPTGTASNPDWLLSLNMQAFSTIDKNVWISSNHCAKIFKSGWWFKHCYVSHLNGPYPNYKQKMSRKKIYWRYWKYINSNNTALRYVSMKLQYCDHGNHTCKL